MLCGGTSHVFISVGASFSVQNQHDGSPASLPERCQVSRTSSVQVWTAPQSAAWLRISSVRLLQHGRFWFGPAPFQPSEKRHIVKFLSNTSFMIAANLGSIEAFFF